MSDSNSKQQDETPPDPEVVLCAASLPTQPAAWAFIGFAATFLAIVGVDFLIHGAETMVSTFGFPVAIIAGIAVGCWPRPQYLREIRISRQEILVTNRDRRKFVIPAQTVEIISMEGQFDLGTQTYEPWGRMHVRAGKTWLAIQLGTVGIKHTFGEVMALMPHALGISGDHQITLPALENMNTAAEWIERLDRQCRRELGRQVKYSLLYAAISMAGGIVLVGYGALRALPTLNLGRHAFVSCGLVLLLAAGGFFTAAWRRWRFLSRVRAQIRSANKRIDKSTW